MAQCYQCGSEVEATDRFCMECRAENPAGAAGPVALPAGIPGATPAFRSTTPTWLPPEDAPLPLVQQSAPQPAYTGSAGGARTVLSDNDAINCPRCNAKLPKNARFCGDCGERLGNLAPILPRSESSLQAGISPPPPVALAGPVPPAVLPAPIAPPISLAGAPSAAPSSAVLPPFRASSWAAQPVPDVPIPDTTWLPPPVEGAAGAPSWPSVPPASWPQPGVAMPQAASPWPSPAVGSPAPGPAWAPAPGANGVGPFAPPAGAGAASPAVANFLQGIAAPAPPVAKKPTYPRGQVITMIAVALVTIGAAIAGLIVQFVLK